MDIKQPIDCRDAMVLLVGVLCGLLAKALPKVHGDKLTVEHTGAGFKDLLAARTSGKFKPRACDPEDDDV
jgi:hypothetical protein